MLRRTSGKSGSLPGNVTGKYSISAEDMSLHELNCTEVDSVFLVIEK